MPLTSGSAPSCTTIGTPRARASIATWLVGLPCSRARPPPADQSISRKRDGGRSSAAITAPGGIAASAPASPLSAPRTRSRKSTRSAARACKYSSGRRAVIGDLLGERRIPGASSAEVARGDGSEDRRRQAVVVEHRQLELEDIGGIAGDGRGERRDLLGGGRRARLRSARSSSARPPGARRRAGGRSSRTSGPAAKPCDAALPFKRACGGAGHRSAGGIGKVLLDQRDQSGDRGLARPRRSPRTRSCCRARRASPSPWRCSWHRSSRRRRRAQAIFELEALGELGQLDRGTRMHARRHGRAARCPWRCRSRHCAHRA